MSSAGKGFLDWRVAMEKGEGEIHIQAWQSRATGYRFLFLLPFAAAPPWWDRKPFRRGFFKGANLELLNGQENDYAADSHVLTDQNSNAMPKMDRGRTR